MPDNRLNGVLSYVRRAVVQGLADQVCLLPRLACLLLEACRLVSVPAEQAHTRPQPAGSDPGTDGSGIPNLALKLFCTRSHGWETV